jgi:hypothetical protein
VLITEIKRDVTTDSMNIKRITQNTIIHKELYVLIFHRLGKMEQCLKDTIHSNSQVRNIHFDSFYCRN